ncbi:hypothetical protein EVAR_35629_1 [Eumeta japonica]|uniref:Uncharacterized protein n=1 Tax=Eumeta variegata TaxID=151549 RepID=A0A4C1WFU0_EUMVA|nr:hypothetical protein EVAR_35629_1 [Eumeta japonica]
MLGLARNIDQGYPWKECAMGYAWVPQRPVSNEWDDSRTTQSYHRTLSRRRRLRDNCTATIVMNRSDIDERNLTPYPPARLSIAAVRPHPPNEA